MNGVEKALEEAHQLWQEFLELIKGR